MNYNTVVILNKQHSLMPEQKALLKEHGPWEVLTVPTSGWSLEEQENMVEKLAEGKDDDTHLTIVFASPVPYMLKALAMISPLREDLGVLVFHNDRREKKELSNGKVIYTVAKEGWQLA